MRQESQVERCEHQDDSNIQYQTFRESVSEEREIYTDYDGYHRHSVKYDSNLSAHCNLRSMVDRIKRKRGSCAGLQQPATD
jgi:hypothetical protein